MHAILTDCSRLQMCLRPLAHSFPRRLPHFHQGCTFCYTGTLGLLGNLTPGQIVEQVVAARRLLFDAAAAEGSVAPAASPITNVVYMGMGEPLDNLQAVLPSLEVLAHPLGLHLSHNKITVSTVGLIPALRRLAAESRAGVAVSLHGVTDAQRSAIVPVNRRHPLGELVGALEELFPRDRAAPGFGRHVLIEYTMLAGVNDAPADAAALAALLARVRCKVNLIEFNPHAGTAFTASPPAALAAFRDVLVAAGMVATVRCSRGDDEMAACGQLGDAGARAARRAAAEARAGAAL
jgi:23S rRNA (adenine2503-C2)-methyltransferase